MTAQPEFSRPLTLDAARRTRDPLTITADPAECAALAQRFELIALNHLSAGLTIRVTGDIITLSGTLSAAAVQRCVATGNPVSATIGEPLALKCVPAAALAVAEEDAEIELADADLDTIDYDGAAIDLGEIAAQSLALALDPWPRSPDADATLRAAGVQSEDEAGAGAFGALAALRDAMKG